MIAALVLSILLLGAFRFMIVTRRRIAHTPVTVRDLEAFDEIVATAIRDAGSDERHLREMSCELDLSDLRMINRNTRRLMEKAGFLKEMTWAGVAAGLTEEQPSSDTVSYVTDLYRGLLRLSSSYMKNMIFSAIEIIFGKIRHHSHYHYTYQVKAEYCAKVDIVETMADIVDEPTALLLRTHLS
jgi:hypothetical protein